MMGHLLVEVSPRLSRTDLVCGPRRFFQPGCCRQVPHKGRGALVEKATAVKVKAPLNGWVCGWACDSLPRVNLTPRLFRSPSRVICNNLDTAPKAVLYVITSICCRTRDLQSRDGAWRGLAPTIIDSPSPHVRGTIPPPHSSRRCATVCWSHLVRNRAPARVRF